MSPSRGLCVWIFKESTDTPPFEGQNLYNDDYTHPAMALSNVVVKPECAVSINDMFDR